MTEPSKDTGIPWIGQLPESWAVATLKRTTYLKGRIGWQGLTTEEYLPNGNYLLVTGTDFEAGRVQWSRCSHVDEERYAEDPYIQLRENDLLITKDGTIGKVAIVRDMPKPATLNSGVFVTRPLKTRYRQDFLYWVLVSDVFPEFIAFSMVGTTINHLYQKTFERFVYPLPQLPEQQRIAAYLDASCAAIDAAVAAKRHQLETLDALRRSIIQRAVTRGISTCEALESTGNAWMEQIPRGWKLVCLKRIAEIQGGLTLGKQYEGPLIERPYLRVGNVQDGHLDLADVSVIELPASVAADVELRPDDVLMTEGGDLDKLGRGYLWKGEIAGCLHQNHIFAVRCYLHKLKPTFLAYVTAARYGRDYFEATGKKTTNLANTNTTKVGEFPIPLPPLTEQEAICVYLEAKLAEAKSIMSGIESQITTLTAYRKSLIHECVTGQRRISQADVRQAGGCPSASASLHSATQA